MNNPSSFDSWIYKTKAGPACVLEINDSATEVVRLNDAYLEALKKANLPIEEVLQINWKNYFDPETAKNTGPSKRGFFQAKPTFRRTLSSLTFQIVRQN